MHACQHLRLHKLCIQSIRKILFEHAISPSNVWFAKLQKWFYYTRMQFWCAVFHFSYVHNANNMHISTIPLAWYWILPHHLWKTWHGSVCPFAPRFHSASTTAIPVYYLHCTCEKPFWDWSDFIMLPLTDVNLEYHPYSFHSSYMFQHRESHLTCNMHIFCMYFIYQKKNSKASANRIIIHLYDCTAPNSV